MNAAAILDRLTAAGVRVRFDPADPERLRLSPPDRLNGELLALARDHKSELLAVSRSALFDGSLSTVFDVVPRSRSRAL